MPRRFQLVDVFSDQPFLGNPLAVIHDADGLTTDQMQAITRWVNFSETTFLLPPTTHGADYRVRIFTPARELPFAGHPTLGSCHAWLRAGGSPRDATKIVQECAAGLIPLRRGAGTLAFAAPPLVRSGPVDEGRLAELAGVLGIARPAIKDAEWVDNGPGWIGLLLESAQAVLDLTPARHHPSELNLGVVGLYPKGSRAAYEVRALTTDHLGALTEDPVTGSLNASIAQWLLRTGRVAAPYTATQGARVGRNGSVEISQDQAGTVWVGGRSTTFFEGEAHL